MLKYFSELTLSSQGFIPAYEYADRMIYRLDPGPKKTYEDGKITKVGLMHV